MIRETQNQILEWSTRNFGEVPNTSIPVDTEKLLKLIALTEKIAHSTLKWTQGIRGTAEEHRQKIVEIGDELIVLLSDFTNNVESGVSEVNMPLPVRISSLFGMVEENGEIANFILKRAAGEISEEEFQAKLVDGIADSQVFTLDFSGRNNVDAQEALTKSWTKVKKRDWEKNKLTGQVDESIAAEAQGVS